MGIAAVTPPRPPTLPPPTARGEASLPEYGSVVVAPTILEGANLALPDVELEAVSRFTLPPPPGQVLSDPLAFPLFLPACSWSDGVAFPSCLMWQ